MSPVIIWSLTILVNEEVDKDLDWLMGRIMVETTSQQGGFVVDRRKQRKEPRGGVLSFFYHTQLVSRI